MDTIFTAIGALLGFQNCSEVTKTGPFALVTDLERVKNYTLVLVNDCHRWWRVGLGAWLLKNCLEQLWPSPCWRLLYLEVSTG